MDRIIINGVGRQGKLALKSLLLWKSELEIFLIDRYWDNETKAQLKFLSKKIFFYEKIEEFFLIHGGKEIELLIDTSTCSGRIERLEKFNQRMKIKYFFIEKPLFNIGQSRFDCVSFREDTYINIPRRKWSLYKFLFDLGPITAFDLEATSWGLLCNTLHYTDVFSNGNNDFDLRIKAHKLIPINARREGFLDALGEIIFEDRNGRSLRLSSVGYEIPEKLVAIIGGKTYQLDEAKGTVSDGTGKIVFEDKNHIIKSFDFLSDLSNLESNLSEFPKFSEVFNANNQIVEMLEKHYPNLLGQFT